MRSLIVDIAKGIAGMLMVLGHAMAFRYSEGWLLQVAHVSTPLFIFLSGVFINIDRPLSESVIRKLDGLLKPYLVVLLVLGVIYAALGGFAALPYLVGILYATGPTIVLVALWFLPHFFLCLLTGVVVLQYCERVALPRYGYVLLLLFLLVVGQAFIGVVWHQPLQQVWWQSMLRPAIHWPGLPWSLDVLPLTLVFLLAGYFFSQPVKALQFRLLPVLMAVLLVVLLLKAGYTEIDINRRIYHDAVFTSLFVVCVIYLVLSFSVLLAKVRILASCLAYIGKNFLVILLLHLLVLRVLFRQSAIWVPQWSLWHVPLVFFCGLLLSILLVVVVQRSRWLSLLLLPVSNRREHR